MCKSSTITIASFIKVKIIDSWLERKGSIQIGKEPQLHNQTIASSVDNFGHRRNLEAEKIGNRTCLAQTDNGSANKECSKKKTMAEGNVCLPENVLIISPWPTKASSPTKRIKK